MALDEYTKQENWRHDAQQFFWATWKHWHAAVGGLLGLGVVGLYTANGNTISLAVLCTISFVCFVIAFFKVWRDQKNINTVLSTKLDSIEKEKLVLDIQLSNGDVDYVTCHQTYRVKVINRHSSRTATNVRVYLKSFQLYGEVSLNNHIVLGRMTYPYQLPRHVDSNSVEIAPFPYEGGVYDLLFTAVRKVGTRWGIGIAPFWFAHSQGAANADYELDSVAFDSTAERRYKLVIQVTADGMTSIEKTVTLVIPEFAGTEKDSRIEG